VGSSNSAIHTAPNPSLAISRTTISTISSRRAVDASRAVTPARRSNAPILGSSMRVSLCSRVVSRLGWPNVERFPSNYTDQSGFLGSGQLARFAADARTSGRRRARASMRGGARVTVENAANTGRERLGGEWLLEVRKPGLDAVATGVGLVASARHA